MVIVASVILFEYFCSCYFDVRKGKCMQDACILKVLEH